MPWIDGGAERAGAEGTPPGIDASNRQLAGGIPHVTLTGARMHRSAYTLLSYALLSKSHEVSTITWENLGNPERETGWRDGRHCHGREAGGGKRFRESHGKIGMPDPDQSKKIKRNQKQRWDQCIRHAGYRARSGYGKLAFFGYFRGPKTKFSPGAYPNG
ncbi:hypothetical protein C8R45DRAFT_946482 [Mycena sanguinolenta]|nr:hypothetical protein C8R45DRAFT_946482 [Mycena sanguinolenta]